MTAMGRLVVAQASIERASPSDRAFLAMDTRDMPEQFGVVLTFGESGGPDLAGVRRLLAARVPAVPRLRQQLVRVPWGCGGPVWVDDPGFDIRRQVRAVACAGPGDEPALLDTALSVIANPLPPAAPLWSAVLVTGPAQNTLALVIVLHHVLADGVGGLAVLASLIDAPGHAPLAGFPRPSPTTASLAREALTGRLEALRHAGRSWHLLRASLSAGGGLRPPRAAPCSLNQRTGARRRLVVIRTSLAAMRAAAHRHGATVNDAVLVAVAGALHRVLLARGESVGSLVVTVPVSGRGQGRGAALGNMVSPMLVSVPAAGPVPDRLRQVAAQVRAHKAAATGPPPIAVLGWLFRPMAALGGYRWYMNHQHRFHTLVSNVRGPADAVAIGGSPVTAAIPVGVGPGGNVPVHFEVLSYAGTLTLTAVIDPDHFPDADELADALRAELGMITAVPRPGAEHQPAASGGHGRPVRPAPRRRRGLAGRALVGLELVTGIAGLAGGVLLAAAPDGSLLRADPAVLAGSPFGDWRVPGVLLAGLVGGGFLLAGWWQWRGYRYARELSIIAGLGLVCFEAAELAWIGFQPLEAVFGLVGVVIVGLAWHGSYQDQFSHDGGTVPRVAAPQPRDEPRAPGALWLKQP